jgi:hypothetical protein
MSWAKLDDKVYLNPKFLKLDPRAIALWTFGIAHAAGLEMDGFIPRDEIPILAARFGCQRSDRAFALATKLVERGLWYEVPTGFKVARVRSSKHEDGELFRPAFGPAGYQIHDYLDANLSAERLLERRKSGAERQARVREKHNDKQHRNAVTNAYPDPTRPDPTQKTGGGAVPPSSSRSEKQPPCYHCQGRGHFASACPEKNRPKPKEICYEL